MKKYFVYSVDVTLLTLVIMSSIFIIETTSFIILPIFGLILIKTGIFYINSRCDYLQEC